MKAARTAVLAVIAAGIIADIATTIRNFHRGFGEANPVTFQFISWVGPYGGLLIAALVKVAMVLLVAAYVRKDQRVAVVYLVIAAVCWYAPIHNLTV